MLIKELNIANMLETTKKEILDCIAAGETEKAAQLMGSPYSIRGEIIHGQGRGRTVGMPTANLAFSSTDTLPKNGVYSTISILDGRRIKGLTSVGLRPAVDDFDYITIETFMLDFDEMIYGRKVELEFHKRIRDILKLPNLEAVKCQIDLDIASLNGEFEHKFKR